MFLFFHEVLSLQKFKGADFKYNKIIFKSKPKNTQIRSFWSQIQGCTKFAPNFALRQIRGLQIWLCLFKYTAQNTQLSGLQYLHQTLLLDKLDGAYCKRGNCFSNFQPKDLNRVFLVPSLFFLFWMKVYSFPNSSVLIKNLMIVLIKLQPKNT